MRECKIVIGLLTLLSVSMLAFASSIQPVRASGPIYIRADGSIEPSTANISSTDNITYYFTGNNYDKIVVEKDNIVVDGAGYAVQVVARTSGGVYLMGRSNVTVKNMEMNEVVLLMDCTHITVQNLNLATRGYCMSILNTRDSVISQNNMTRKTIREHKGSCFAMLIRHSSNNTISGNNITDIFYAISVTNSSDNRLIENNIVHTTEGIELRDSSNNSIAENNLTRSRGFHLVRSANNNISGNHIASSRAYGIWGRNSSDNIISGNNITNSKTDGIIFFSGTNNSVSRNYIANSGAYGIWGRNSSDNIISGNNLTNNRYGIIFRGTNNSVSRNYITNSEEIGISGGYPSDNVISGNNITNSRLGIRLRGTNNRVSRNNITNNNGGIYFDSSSNNTITENYIAGNDYGIYLRSFSLSNKFHHNNFVNNIQQVYFNESSYTNFWDDGYPSGGNYWSGHVCTGNPSNGSQPYAIDASNIDSNASNIDNYPFQDPIDWLLPAASAGSDQTVKVNTIVSFDASGSSDNVEIVSYEWDFGDGTSGTGMTTTHTYAQPGTYTITLKVTDGAGNSDTDTITVTSVGIYPLADLPLWTLGVAVAAVVGVATIVYFSKVRKP